MVGLQVGRQSVGNFLGSCLPDLNGVLIALFIRDKTTVEVLHDLFNLLVSRSQDRRLLFGDDSVRHGNGDGGKGGILIALCLDVVQHDSAALGAMLCQAAADDVRQLLLGDLEIDFVIELMFGVGAIHIAQILRDGGVEDDLADSGGDKGGFGAVAKVHGAAHLNGSLQGDDMLGVSHQGFVLIAEHLVVAGVFGVDHGQVVRAQDHILRGHGDGFAVRRLQQVAGSQHQHLGFALCFGRQRQMDSHLVAVEVSVEGGADQRVQLDGVAFDQNGLKCLNAQAVQGRCTVQQNGMALDDGFERVPHLGGSTLDLFAGSLDVGGNALLDQVLHNEGLEQLQSHLFGQTALVHLQLRADNDNGTARVVNTFAQQVLAEAALLALQHIGKALEGAVVGASDRAAAAAVINQGVNCFLQHTLFVAHDDVGSAQLQQALQTVVAVDHATVQIIQVGSRKAAAIQLDHGADIRRNDRNNVQDHPLRALAGQAECINALQAFQQADALLAGSLFQFLMQLCGQSFQVDLSQQLLDGFGAHAGFKGILVLFPHLLVLAFGQELLFLQRSKAGIGNDIVCKVEHLVQLAGADVQHQANAAGNALEIPDVRNGCSQLNVAHALTADLSAGNFDTALIADLALIADALILAAVAFPVLGRSKNALAEQAVALRLQGAVVDGFRFLDLAIAPGTDLVGRSKADLDRIELFIFHSANPLI